MEGLALYPERQGIPFNFPHSSAKRARAGKNGKSPVKSTLEHLPFQIHNSCKEVFDEFDSAPALGFGCFEMKQNGAAVRIQDFSGLIRCGRIRGTAIPPAVPGAAILALQSHPRGCDNALRIDFFCLGWFPSCDLFPVDFQTLGWFCFFHKQTVIPANLWCLGRESNPHKG